MSRSLPIRNLVIGIALAALFSSVTASAQQAQPASQGSTLQPVVPRLIQFNNVLKDNQNKPLSGVVPATFAIYAAQEDSTPLWMETQDVTPGADGNYTVLLGAASQGGLPAELFAKGEARWLGIQTPEQPERPRILLVSVPYALKAADADTLGGLPASAFLTTSSATANSAASKLAVTAAPLLVPVANTSAAAISGTGTTNYLPLWTSSSNLGNSILFQSSGSLEVSGALQLPTLGIATAAVGFNSQPFDLFSSAYNSSTKTAVSEHFRWQAETVSNNTASPSGKLNLLFASGPVAPAETGLSISSKGILTFVSGQTLPAVTGNETVSGTVSASQLISTVATGTAPAKVTSTTQVANLNASLLDGLSASAFQPVGSYATLGANAFTATQTINGALNLTGSINSALILQGNVTNPVNGSVGSNVIGGDASNTVTNGSTGATISGGGRQNIVSGDWGTVGGGTTNRAGAWDTVGGGQSNYASDLFTTVAGGYQNTSDFEAATVAGGFQNTSDSEAATVAGGFDNHARGLYSTVAGGSHNVASGVASFAAGTYATASDDGSFLWCQNNLNPCHSLGVNSFQVAVDGPIFFYDGNNGQGCFLSAGSGSWTCSSDRNLKNNIRSIDSRSVLQHVADMPISQWNMKSDIGAHNHIGPMAQDFYAAFGLGESDKYIAQGDAQGVALASIQGLYRIVQEKNEQMGKLVQEKDEQVRALQSQLQALEGRMARFEAALGNLPR